MANGNMLNGDLMTAIEAIRPLLRQFVIGNYGIAVGGSHAKKMADPGSDLDLYVFAGSLIPNSERTRLTQKGCSNIREIISWGQTEPFDQAGTDCYLGNLKIECWFRNTAFIERMINECTEGIVKRDFITWTTTGFYNHCVLSDLLNMIIIEDPSHLLRQWKNQIIHYPPKLRCAIIQQHLKAALFWRNNFHYRSAIERQDVIYTTGIIQQVVHHMIQVLFAVNRVYFPGDKKLAAAMAHLHNVPDRFAERIQNLIFPGSSVSLENLRTQQQELHDLLNEVEVLVQTHR